MVLALRVLFYLVSVAFIVIVLIQPDRSHGMSGSGGGANFFIWSCSRWWTFSKNYYVSWSSIFSYSFTSICDAIINC